MKTIAVDALEASSAQRAVARVLELLHGNTQHLNVIEIEAGGVSIGDHLEQSTITRLDSDATVAALREGGEPEAPGTLAFPTGFFDYAVAVDVLERFEPSLRLPLLAELRRVSRQGVVIVGPFDSEWVRGIDRIIGDAIPAAAAGPTPPRELPALDDTTGFFEAHGDETTVYGDADLPLWAATRCLALGRPELKGDLGHLEVGGGVYRRASNGDHPSYRSLVVCLREASDLNGEVLGGAPGVQAARPDGGSVAAMLATVALSNELRELHRRLAVEEERLSRARATLARRDAQIEDLSHRLADSLTELAADRGERDLSHREIATMQKARAWRVMARLYFATGRVRYAVKAPVRLVRDLSGRLRRRVRAR
jgi:hypothetical protein